MRTPEVTIDVDELTVREANYIIDDIQRVSREAAVRIGSKIDFERFPKYLYPYVSYDEVPDIYVTDRPEKIFGGHDTLYAVTSSLSLEQMHDGNVLWPPVEHTMEDIYTHRGIGLVFFPEMMRLLGFDLGTKDHFIWLTPQIDGEQFVLEDAIARKGPRADKEIASLLFSSFPPRYEGERTLQPQLKNLITALYEGRKVYKEESTYRQYIDNFLDRVYRTMAGRDGWFGALEALLKGQIPFPSNRDLTPDWFEKCMCKRGLDLSPAPRASQAIILAIDTATLFNLTPIYPFPLTSTDVVPSPHVPSAAIKAIYAESKPEGLEEPLLGLMRPLEAVPHESWLPAASGEHVAPAQVRRRGVHPRKPLNALRYNSGPTASWTHHINNGDMAPWWFNIRLNTQKSRTKIEYCLDTLILSKILNSDVLRSIIEVSGKPAQLTERVFSIAHRMLSLASVQASDERLSHSVMFDANDGKPLIVS